MASYSAVIDLRVNGLNGLKKVEDRVSAITGLLKQLKPVPAVFAGAKADVEDFKKAKKELSDYVEAVGKGSKRGQVFSTTLAGISSQMRAFNAVAANATQGSDQFNNAIRASERASVRLAQAEAARLKVQQEFYTGNQAEGQSTAVRDIIKLGNALPKTISGLEFYQQQLKETQTQVLIGSNAFRALEEAIADVDKKLSSARLSGQASKIQVAAGPATQLGSLAAFKARERFEQNIEQQLIRQLAVEQRINQANLDDVQKAQLRNQLGEATNQLVAKELVFAKQITNEVERQRISLERAKRARKESGLQGGTRRTGQFSPLTAPKRLQNIQDSAVVLQEKLNTLTAKGVDVSQARSRVEQLILNTKDSGLTLDLRTLNALDAELNGLRQIVKLENQILSTKKAQGTSDKTAAKAKGKTRNRLQQAAIGGAFPALFGGGPLSIIGGAVGEFFGPLMGVVGSAIGGAIEDTAVKISEFGSALNKPTENLEKLARAAGLAGTAAGRRIELAEFLGAPEIGGRIAQDELAELVGEGGVKGLKNLGTESTRLANSFEALKTRLGSAFAPFLAALAKGTTILLGGGTDRGDTFAREAELRRQVSFPARTRTEKSRRRFQLKELAELEEYNKTAGKSNQDLNTIIKARLAPLKAAADLEQNRLSLTRDALAAQEGQVRVLQVQKTLTELQTRAKQLDAGIERDKLNILIQQTEEQVRQAKLAKENAIRLAEIQIERDTSKQVQREFTALNEQFLVARQLEELTQSDQRNYVKKQLALQRQLDFQVALKLEQMKMNLLTIKEPDLRMQTMRAVAQEIALLKEKFKLQEEQIRQNEVMRQDAERAVIDQRNFNKVQQALTAQRDINQMDPSRAFAAGGPGIGFFEQSVLLEANLLEDRILQLELYNRQIEMLETRLSELKSMQVDPDKLLPLQRQLADLRQTKDTYEALQPAIDAARVKQEQFNNALAMVSPAVTSLINGFSEVVQGTKSAQEAFSDFLRTIGDTLVQEGTRMIATYIAIGIAKAFAGLSGGGDLGATMSNTDYFNSTTGLGVAGPNFGLANGGPAKAGQPYMVGERGPELFIPGSNGGVMRNEDMRQLMGRSPAASNAPQMNFSFETTNIGGQEFVSREQLEAAMATTRRQAANDGAKRGMSMTLDKMQNSPRTRSRIGIS